MGNATRYHIGKNGPSKCDAKEGNCPLGGEHFGSKADAQKGFDEKNKSQMFASLSRKNNINAKRYHIGSSGVEVCPRQGRVCSKTHYDSFEEAEDAMTQHYGDQKFSPPEPKKDRQAGSRSGAMINT